jgi:hypothetical protein
MLTRRLVLSGLTMFLPAASSFAAPQPKPVRDPAAIVAEIYNPKREEIYGGAFGLSVAERRKYLSRELIGLWARADKRANPTGKEAGPIDWDVTTNSQGLEVGSYTLEVAKQDDNRVELKATIEAKSPWTRNSPDENIIRFHFIREGGRWVIDDVRSADDDPVKGLKGHLIFHATGQWPRR